MPGTGNNILIKEKILSICISADGLCFWDEILISSGNNNVRIKKSDKTGVEYKDIEFDDALSLRDNIVSAANEIKKLYYADGKPSFDKIIVYLSTPKTILIPEAIFTSGAESSYLELHNYTVSETEQTDVSKPINGTISIMVSPKEILKSLGESFGEFAVASPLQYNIMLGGSIKRSWMQGKRTNIIALFTENLIYISAFDNSKKATSELIYTSIAPYAKPDDILFHLTWVRNNISKGKSWFHLRGSVASDVILFLKKHLKGKICA